MLNLSNLFSCNLCARHNTQANALVVGTFGHIYSFNCFLLSGWRSDLPCRSNAPCVIQFLKTASLLCPTNALLRVIPRFTRLKEL